MYLAGNANKHLKLTTQHVKQVPEKQVLGSFRRSDTRIMLECPEREVPAWSFVPLGLTSQQSRQLYAELRGVGIIDLRKVYSPESGKTHPAMLRVVEAAAHGDSLESAQEEFVKVLMGLTLPFTLTETVARRVGAFLVDRALLTAYLKVESNTSVPIRDLIARALAGTQRWLDEVHAYSPIEAGDTPTVVAYVVDPQVPLPLLSLEAHVEMYRTHREAYLNAPAVGSEWVSHRLQVVQEVEWRLHDLEAAGVELLTASQAGVLDDIYCNHHMYEDSERLHKHHASQLSKRTHSPGDRDTWCQLASCQRMLWSIRRYHQPERSLASREEVTGWATHVLIKLRALTEQTLDRVCRRLVCWPNQKFPAKTDRLRKLLSAQTEQDLTTTASRCRLVDSGAVDLRVQYAEVWSALLKFDSGAWDRATRITDVAKHERGLQLEDSASGLVLVCSEGRLPVLPLLQSFVAEVRALVEVLNGTQAETEELLEAAKQTKADNADSNTSNDLAEFQGRMPLDRADTAGNTPLHWACRHDNVDQLLTLAQDPVTLRRACRANSRGERPLTLGNGTCSAMLRRHLDAHAVRFAVSGLSGGW